MLVETALQRYLQDGTLESAQPMNDELREATIDTVRCIARNINQSSPNANIAFIALWQQMTGSQRVICVCLRVPNCTPWKKLCYRGISA